MSVIVRGRHHQRHNDHQCQPSLGASFLLDAATGLFYDKSTDFYYNTSTKVVRHHKDGGVQL